MFSPGIKYDAEKEEKQLQEARQRELQRIEETKQKAAEQGQGSSESQDDGTKIWDEMMNG